jgi:hypothetical protein
MKFLLPILLMFATCMFAQSPQTSTAPLYDVNAKYTNGVAPGYAPTIDAGGGPFLDIGPGTAFCGSTVRTAVASVFQLNTNATSYIYLDTTASCAVTVSTSVFTSTQIPIAIVVVSNGLITGITDVRTPFNSNSVSGSYCSLGGCTLTGTLTLPSMSFTGSSAFITGTQGTDSNLITSGTISGAAGTSVCLDAGHGLTTSGCTMTGNATSLQGFAVSSTSPTNNYALVYNAGATQWQPTNLASTYCTLVGCTLTGTLTLANVSITGSSAFITGIQGTDSNLISSGTISGAAGTGLCLDSNGGATTTGCTLTGNATSIQGVAVNTVSPTLNQVIEFNGTQYIPTTLPVTTSISLPATCSPGALWTNPSPTGSNNVIYECYSTNNWITLNPSMSGSPTIGADSGAGTSPTVSLIAGSSDQAGWINVTTGSSPVASAGVVTITFGNTNYASQPVCNIYPASATTAALSGTGQVYVSQSSSSSTLFVASVGSSALAGATAYKWGYSCILP